MSFCDFLLEKKRIRNNILDKLEVLINWKDLEIEVRVVLHKGKSVDGRPSYPALLLFKMLLLGYFFNLSDYEVEDQVIDRISFKNFVGVLTSWDRCKTR